MLAAPRTWHDGSTWLAQEAEDASDSLKQITRPSPCLRDMYGRCY